MKFLLNAKFTNVYWKCVYSGILYCLFYSQDLVWCTVKPKLTGKVLHYWSRETHIMSDTYFLWYAIIVFLFFPLSFHWRITRVFLLLPLSLFTWNIVMYAIIVIVKLEHINMSIQYVNINAAICNKELDIDHVLLSVFDWSFQQPDCVCANHSYLNFFNVWWSWSDQSWRHQDLTLVR